MSRSPVIELKRGIETRNIKREREGEREGTAERRNTVSVKDYTFHDSLARVEMGKAGGAITRDYQKREGRKESDRCSSSVKPINL